MASALPVSGTFARLPVIAADAGYVVRSNSHDRWYFTAFAFHDEWFILKGGKTPFFNDYIREFDPEHQHQGKYGYELPDATTMLSYDAASVLWRGVQNAEKGKANITPQDLVDGLSHIDSAHPIQGISGQIAFDPSSHDPVNKAFVLLHVPNGFINMLCVSGNFFPSGNNPAQECS
jgi:eukaryotic-like serine/threonine-protein kinase